MHGTWRGPLDRNATVYVAGHGGLVGSAIWRHLERKGFRHLVGRRSAELDLRDRTAVEAFFAAERPEVVVLAAARVGGIGATSSYPADFLSDNLRIQTNVLDVALAHGVPRLLFLGSSCVYPRNAEQPIREECLLSGPLEPTTEAYALAKITGVMQVRAVRRQHGLPWISAMPTSLYGPGDDFHPERSYVLPSLIRRFHEAAEAGLPAVTCWGSGRPRREFLHVDDLAAACLHLLDHYDGDGHINVGSGTDVTVADLARAVAEVIGFTGEIRWDSARPDGTPRKLLDVDYIRSLGWSPRISLAEGLRSTYSWYVEHLAEARGAA